MIEQRYNLSMIPCGVNPIVRVSQYDDGSRTIVFNLTNNEYEIEDAEIVIDGQTVESSIEGGKVQFIVYLAQTSESGMKRGEVRLGDIGSLNFKFYVEKTPIELSANELNTLMSNSLSNRQTPLQSLENGLQLIPDRIDKIDKTIDEISELIKDEYEPIKEKEIDETLDKEKVEEEVEEPTEEEPDIEVKEETEIETMPLEEESEEEDAETSE